VIEYVEGDDELEAEEEEDMEDFSGLPSKESYLEGDDHGNIHLLPVSYNFHSIIESMYFEKLF
jgi:hypothetical protein